MRNGVLLLLGFLVVFLVPSVQAATTYSQNFDGLNLGSIVGQDSYTSVSNGNLWVVGTFPTFQGTQSVNTTTAGTTNTVARVITNNPNGSMVLRVNSTGTTNTGPQFSLWALNGSNIIYTANFNASDGNVSYADNAANPALTPFTSGEWTRIDFRWDNNSEYVICVNRIVCTTAVNRNANTGTPDSFRFNSQDQASPSGSSALDYMFIFDTFLPDESVMAASIDSPLNVSYNRSNVELNVTAPTAKNFTYSLNGALNISVENNTLSISTGLFGLPEGFNELDVYVLEPDGSATDLVSVNFTVNATGEARFIDANTATTLTQAVTFRISNLTNTQTTTTSSGTARFNWTEMPKGSATIEINTTNATYLNQSISDTLGFFEDFNRSFTLQQVGNFNASVFDEMRKSLYNFSIVNTTFESMTLKVFCANSEEEVNISSATNENLSFGCEVLEARMTVEFFDQTIRPFRSLRPTTTAGDLRFWMFENITEDNVYLQLFTISDLVGTFKEGQLVIRKLINSSLETIHQVTIQPDGSAFAYLIDGERYQITIISSDGTTERSIGDFNALESTSSVPAVLEATTLEYNPAFSLLFTDVGWTFDVDEANDRLTFRYVDSANQTTSITYTIVNASNTSQVLFTSTSTERRIIYEFSYIVSDINESYLSSFTAQHTAHGTISRSVIQDFSGIKMTLRGVNTNWYMIFGLFLVIVPALLFGAKFNEIAGVAVAFMAGLLWYWGWFPPELSLTVILIGIALSVLNMMRRGERT